MRLGTAWFGFREQTASNYFEMAAAIDLCYVEVPLYWQIVEDFRFNYRSPEDVEAICRLAEQSGVRMVSGVTNLPIAEGATSWGGTVNSSMIAFSKAAARRAIDLGVRLGLEVIRVIEPSIPSDQLSQASDYMQACGQTLRELGDYAAERNMLIVVENYGLLSDHVSEMLATADHPAVGTLYDPCNYLRIGEDPLQALRNVREKVYYCHFKDAQRHDSRDPSSLFPGSRWPPSVAVGEGDIDWPPIVAELAAFFRGYVCIEYEMADDVMRGTRVSRDYLRQVAEAQGVSVKLCDRKNAG